VCNRSTFDKDCCIEFRHFQIDEITIIFIIIIIQK